MGDLLSSAPLLVSIFLGALAEDFYDKWQKRRSQARQGGQDDD